MIKKLVLAVAVALALPVVANAQKFGIVNPDEIISQLPEFTTMQTQIEEASKSYESEFEKLREELDKKYTEFQSLPEDTPQSIKDRRIAEIQELDGKMQQFRNTAQQDLQRQQQTLFAPIEQKLIDAINAVGQEGGFTFIFQDGQAAYTGKDVINVTPEVKAKLGLK